MVHSGSVKRNAEDGAGQPPKKKPALDIATSNHIFTHILNDLINWGLI